MGKPNLTAALDAIESELRRLKYLDGTASIQAQVTSAFGQGQVSFETWLGHVFLPNARKAVLDNALPDSSQVAVAAMRHFDGDHSAKQLVQLLYRFDEMINNLGRSRGISK